MGAVQALTLAKLGTSWGSSHYRGETLPDLKEDGGPGHLGHSHFLPQVPAHTPAYLHMETPPGAFGEGKSGGSERSQSPVEGLRRRGSAGCCTHPLKLHVGQGFVSAPGPVAAGHLLLVLRLGGGAVTSTSRHSGPNGGSDKPGLSWRKEAGGPVAPWPRRPGPESCGHCASSVFTPNLPSPHFQESGKPWLSGSREGVVACI